MLFRSDFSNGGIGLQICAASDEIIKEVVDHFGGPKMGCSERKAALGAFDSGNLL